MFSAVKFVTILSLRQSQRPQFLIILSIEEHYTEIAESSMFSVRMNFCEAQELKRQLGVLDCI